MKHKFYNSWCLGEGRFTNRVTIILISYTAGDDRCFLWFEFFIFKSLFETKMTFRNLYEKVFQNETKVEMKEVKYCDKMSTILIKYLQPFERTNVLHKMY